MRVLIDNQAIVEFQPEGESTIADVPLVDSTTVVAILKEWRSLGVFHRDWTSPPSEGDHPSQFVTAVDSTLTWIAPSPPSQNYDGLVGLYSLADIDHALGRGTLDFSDEVQ